MIGKKIDERYTISEEIGRGSMGHVYRALDEETRREVALKIVDLTQSPNPSDLQWRFRREAKTLLTLDHPNIVSCFAMGELGQENRFYLVMEYLKGQVLTEYLEQHEPLSVDTALDIVQQLARALAYIHQRGIVHRDIKPSNVIVSINGTFRAKLLDFGLAHLAGDDGPGEGALVGTFPYMSPEQTGVVRQALDGRSDLYSLGVTFYRMLTGQLPFQADSINALIHQHLARRPTPPHELREGLPDDVERMILRLLEKDVAARYQTAEGLAEDIERTKSGQQGFELSTDARQQAQVFNTIGLVGRDNELETIDRLLGRAAAGDGQVLFVSGSAGIGKSRLMDELRTRAASKRGTFLIGSCEETDRRIPFHPLKSAISDYLMQMRGETTKVSRLRSIGKRYGGVLCQIIPELKQILPEIGPALPANTPAQARKRLFLTALVDLFSQWGASGEPLVLLLEDLHWVDLGTLQFLEAAAAKLTSAHCLVALTAIDEASGHPRRLSRYLGIMRETKAPFTAFELAPFDLEAMQAFIIGKLGQPPERLKTVARLVLQRTQGIPYEASTYVETLVTEGVLWRDPGGWKLDEEKFDTLRYSTEVVNTIVRRLAMIDRAKYHLLSLASVIGNEVEFALLHHISGRSADELMDALEEGTRHRLIVQQGHQLLYKFSHQK
ncbi:MAG: protein kinase, partial [Myxococcales bacterium]|nr:protein kinase [Myxococcales bacterium]